MLSSYVSPRTPAALSLPAGHCGTSHSLRQLLQCLSFGLLLPEFYLSYSTSCCPCAGARKAAPIVTFGSAAPVATSQLSFPLCETPGHLRASAKMWPLWGLDLNRVRCDLLFTEAINQRMQVPNRLKVAESCSPGDRKTRTEDVPPSFRMHIPERISLAGKALGCLLGWLKVGGACGVEFTINLPQFFATYKHNVIL